MGKVKKKKTQTANHTTPGPLSKALLKQQNSSLLPAGRQLGLCHMQASPSIPQCLKKGNLQKVIHIIWYQGVKMKSSYMFSICITVHASGHNDLET